MMRGGHQTIAAAVLCGAATLLTMSHLWGTDSVPAYRDLLFFVVPFKHYLADRLRGGEIPLWNPWVYLGTPFFAGHQTAVAYPPSLLLLLPFPLGFNVFLIAHYAIALAGSWLFLRDRGLAPPSCAAGTLVFVLGGYLVSVLNVTNHLQASVWAPAVLFVWRRCVAGSPLRWWAALVAMLLMQVLAGAPEAMIMTITVAAAWGMYVTLPDVGRLARVSARLGLALAVTAGLAAFQLIPTAEHIAQSVRSGSLGLTHASLWSLEPVSIIQLILPWTKALTFPPIPHAGRFESTQPWLLSLYFGVPALVLSVAGVVTGRERRFWAALALVGSALALGRHTPLLPMIYEAVPSLVGRFRFPEKFFFMTHLAAAVLAAEGAERVLIGDRRAERIAWISGTTLGGVALGWLVLRWAAPSLFLESILVWSGRVPAPGTLFPMAANLEHRLERLLLMLVALLVLLGARRVGKVGLPLFANLLACVTAADLVSAHFQLNPTVSWSDLRAQSAILRMETLGQTRQRMFLYQTVDNPHPGGIARSVEGLDNWASVISLRNMPSESRERTAWQARELDAGMVDGVGSLSGADGIETTSEFLRRSAIRVVPRDRALKLLRIFGVAELAGSAELPFPDVEPLDPPGSSALYAYRFRDPVPTAYLASRLFVASTPRDAFNVMIATDFRPGSDAAVEALPGGWVDAVEAPAGTANITRDHPEEVRIRVDAVRQALLVLSDSYFPGWEAAVDGHPVEIIRTNGIVRGVLVPRGQHEVTFAYRPRSLRIGLAITLLTAAAVLLGLVATKWPVRGHSRRSR